MRKRLSSKLLAVVLTIAICATTVFGCLMTVSAADSCYSFGDSKFEGEDLTQATIDVTFTAPASLPNGFAAGAFAFGEVNADGEDYLIFKDVTSNDANVSVEGNYVVFDSMSIDDNDNIVVDGAAAVKTAKFTFTVGFNAGAATDRTYQIALSEVELAFNDAEYYIESAAGPVGEIKAACEHTLVAVGTLLATDDANGYSVYDKTVCSKCGEPFDGYQLVPGETVVDEVVDTITMDSNTSIAPTKGTGTKADPYIIESVNNLIYIATAGPDATYNKYYKVADGIKNIVLQPSAIADDVMELSTLDEVEDFFATSRTQWVDPGNGYVSGGDEYSKAFCGHFDGNGATIYGLYRNGSNMSLFGSIGVNSSFENFAIKNSYGTTGWYAGLLSIRSVGFTLADGEVVKEATTKMDRIELSNNKIKCSTGVNPGTGSFQNGNQCVGLLFAQSDYTNKVSGFSLTNLLVYGNEIEYTHADNGGVYTHLYGVSSGVAVADETSDIYITFENSVILDCAPWGVGNSATLLSNWSNMENVFSDFDFTTAKNTYYYNATDYHDYKQITKESVIGPAALTALVAGTTTTISWGDVWLCGTEGEYPSLRNPNEVMSTIYWSGSAGSETMDTLADDPSETGSLSNPIIIDNAEELHVLALSPDSNWGASVSNTTGKYFKVADHIDTIILQSYINVAKAGGVDAIIGISTTAEVEKLFTQTLTSPNNWITNTNEAIFNGNFNGNGVKIYGLYASAAKNVGLFPCVDGGTPDPNGEDYVGNTFENFAIRNSYYNSQNRLGGVVSIAYGKAGAAKVDGNLNFENIEISNNCMIATGSQAACGVVLGNNNNSETYAINNCLVYGNNATCNSTTAIALCGGGKDRFVWVDGAQDKTQRIYACTVKNTVTLGTQPYNYSFANSNSNKACFENVYTDADISAYEAASQANLGSGYATYYDGVLFPVSASQAMGAAAKSFMPKLAWGSVWYCGTSTGYPVLAPFATLGTSGVSSAYLELVGHNTTYNEDGSFDFNFHFVPETTGIKPVLYVGTVDASKFMKLEATTSSLTSQLGENALMYTIPNLSARDIDLIWLPTLVTDDSEVLEWGKSEQIALVDNAKKILNDEAVYGEDATDEEKIADKKVAAALLNYGNASDAALNVSAPDYDAGEYDVFQGEVALRIKYDQAGDESKDMNDSANWVLKVNGDGAPHQTWGYIDADIKLLDESKDNSESNPYIIESAEQLFYLTKIAGNFTKGKYYKVKDGITEIRLNPNVTADTDFEKAKEILAAGGTNWDTAAAFQGHFDGNGVTISGLRTTTNHANSGLFPQTKGNVTIKNVNITNSYMACYAHTGALVGTTSLDTTDTSNPFGSLTIENCSVTNCYMESTGVASWGTVQTRSGVAAIVGHTNFYTTYTKTDDETTYSFNGLTSIKNCYVELDENNFISACESTDNTDILAKGLHGGLTLYNGSNQYKAENCVVIGVKPYTVWDSTCTQKANHNNAQGNFSNIYTDQSITEGYSNATAQVYTDKMFKLTTDQLTGLGAKENMSGLDWDTTWTTTSGYPTLINKNYESSVGKTIYYTGTAATIGTKALTEGTGEKDSPYIINTVEELAWVVTQSNTNVAATQGKYFKVADGITSIVLQKADYVNDILALGSAAETKAYFEANSANMVKWPNSGSTTFCGNIDFNDATIYGLYQVSSNNAGLFSYIEAGAVISNLGIKNSYITSTASNWQIGAIAAVSNYSGSAAKINGIIWTKNCTVANNYLHSNYVSESDGNNSRSGVLIGASTDTIYMDNMLVYGNDATGGDGSKLPIVSTLGNAIPEGVEVPEGLVTAFAGQNSSGQNLHVNKLRNSIILGCDPYDLTQQNGSRFNDLTNCYENVYTDADIANDKFANGTAASGIKGATQVTDLTTLKGDAAASVVTTLNTSNTVGTWYVGNEFEYPGLKEATAMPSNIQAFYDSMVLSTYDTVGAGTTYQENGNMSFGVYGTSLNLKANPYIAFTFAFLDAHKNGTEDQISITFKSGDTVIETVSASDMTHNTGAGRYFLYRLKNVPVMALSTGITVTASVNGATAVDLGTYSAEGFALLADSANKQQPCSYYATRYEAAKALLFYTDMLVERYGK